MRLDASQARDGAVIRYGVRKGTRAPVVLLHGAGMDHTTFDDVAGALADDGHTVVALDQRGHGASRPGVPTAERLVTDVEAIVSQLGAARPVLVGHSLGGNVAQDLVRRDPTRYAGLVVIGSTWNAGPLARWERVSLALATPLLALIPGRRLPGMLADASAATEEGRAEARRLFEALTPKEFLAAWRATAHFVSPAPAARTPIPLLLVRGADDATGNIATAMPRWASAEGVQERIVDGAGHLVMADAPTETITILRGFLAGLAA